MYSYSYLNRRLLSCKLAQSQGPLRGTHVSTTEGTDPSLSQLPSLELTPVELAEEQIPPPSLGFKHASHGPDKGDVEGMLRSDASSVKPRVTQEQRAPHVLGKPPFTRQTVLLQEHQLRPLKPGQMGEVRADAEASAPGSPEPPSPRPLPLPPEVPNSSSRVSLTSCASCVSPFEASSLQITKQPGLQLGLTASSTVSIRRAELAFTTVNSKPRQVAILPLPRCMGAITTHDILSGIVQCLVMHTIMHLTTTWDPGVFFHQLWGCVPPSLLQSLRCELSPQGDLVSA